MNAQEVLDALREKYPDKDWTCEITFPNGDGPEGYVDPMLVEIESPKETS